MFRMKNKSVGEGEQSKVLKYWGTYSVLFVTLGAMTFFGVCTPGGPNASVSGNAAVVGSEKISMAEFRRAYRQQTDRLKSQYQDRYDPAILKPAESTLEQLVSDRIMYLSALDMGLQASDDEVVRYLIEINAFQDDAGKFSQKNFESYLRYNSYSEASFMEEMQRSLTLQKLRSLVTSSTFSSSKAAEFDYRISETKLNVEYLKFTPAEVNVTVSTDEVSKFSDTDENKKKIESWYNSHRSDYSQEEKVHARHILVSFKGARNATGDGSKRSKEDAKKRAEELLVKVKKAGADFAAIAKKETDEPSGKNSGGDLGFFTRQAMVKEFSDVAFTLEAGKISEITESPFGFHIIKVEAKKAKKEQTLADATADIARKLIKKDKAPKMLEARANEVLGLLKSGKPAAAKLKEYKTSWKKTGQFAANASTLPGLGSAKDVQPKLLTLTKEKPLVDSLTDISGNKYVIRLIERVEPDMKKLDKEKLEQLTGSLAFSKGYQMFSSWERFEKKRYQDKKAIVMNPNFLALDVPNSDQQ